MIRILVIFALLIQPLAAMREATMVCLLGGASAPAAERSGDCCGQSTGCCGEEAEQACCEPVDTRPCECSAAAGVAGCCSLSVDCCCVPAPAGAPAHPLALPVPGPDLQAVVSWGGASYPSLAVSRTATGFRGTGKVFVLCVGERLALLCVRTT